METRIFLGKIFWISFDWFIYFSVKYHWLIYSNILSFHWPKLNYTDMGGVRYVGAEKNWYYIVAAKGNQEEFFYWEGSKDI